MGKPFFPAVVGVGDLACMVRLVFEFRVEASEQSDAVGRRPEGDQGLAVVQIHGDEPVEAREMHDGVDLLGPARKFDAVRTGDGDGPRVGSFPDVPRAGARALYVEAVFARPLTRQMNENALRKRRSADVSQADKEQADLRIGIDVVRHALSVSGARPADTLA